MLDKNFKLHFRRKGDDKKKPFQCKGAFGHDVMSSFVLNKKDALFIIYQLF